MSINLLGRLNVRGRIYGGFGAVMAILGIALGAAVYGIDGGLESMGEYSRISGNATQAAMIDRDGVELRRLIRLFQLSPGEENAAKVKKQVELAVGKVGEIIANTKHAERKQMLEETRDLLVEYGAGAEEVTANTLSIQKEREEVMDVRAGEMADVLTKEHDDAAAAGNDTLADRFNEALVAVMQYRLDVMRSVDRGIKEAADNLPKDQAAVEAALKTIRGIPGADLQALDLIVEDFAAYSEVATKVVSAKAEVSELLDVKLAAVGNSLTEQVATYVGSVNTELARIETSTLETLSWTFQLALILSAAAVVLGAGTAWLVGRSIVNPVSGMTSAMGQLAGGDTSTEIPARERTDEIGRMAAAVQVFKENMIETDRLRAEQEELKKRAEAERRKAMLELADRFEASVGGVVGAVTSAATELQATAQSLSATAEETSQQSNAVAAASEQMTQNVQTVASATEELSSSIREIGNQVTESTRIVGAAVTQAQDTNAKVKMLAEAAQKIGDVVTLINEIAAQTNLLALNATIEAARAGEAGKGFAVVASEVKNLATQTAKATEEIAGQVRAIQDATDTSAQAIDTIAQTINRVSEISTTIASAVEEQGAATQEISRNVQEASSGTQEVSNNIAGVTQASQQTSAGSTQVLSAAGELAKNGDRLKQEVSNFLATIRAA